MRREMVLLKSKNKKHKMDNISSTTKNAKRGHILQEDKPSTFVKEKKIAQEDGLTKSLQKKLKGGM